MPGRLGNRGEAHGGIDPDDILAAVKLNRQGRVGLVRGDYLLLPPELRNREPEVLAASGPSAQAVPSVCQLRYRQSHRVLDGDDIAVIGLAYLTGAPLRLQR